MKKTDLKKLAAAFQQLRDALLAVTGVVPPVAIANKIGELSRQIGNYADLVGNGEFKGDDLEVFINALPAVSEDSDSAEKPKRNPIDAQRENLEFQRAAFFKQRGLKTPEEIAKEGEEAKAEADEAKVKEEAQKTEPSNSEQPAPEPVDTEKERAAKIENWRTQNPEAATLLDELSAAPNEQVAELLQSSKNATIASIKAILKFYNWEFSNSEKKDVLVAKLNALFQIIPRVAASPVQEPTISEPLNPEA